MTTAVHLAEAAARHFEAGRTEEAALLYRRLLEDHGEAATAHAGLGAVAVKRGDRHQALAHCKAALAAAGESAPAYADLGGAYSLAGQAEPAEACFRRALALDSGLVGAAVGLGGLLTEKGDLEAGRRLLEAALVRLADAESAQPVCRQRCELAYNLAVNAQAAGDPGRAEALLTWAIAQFPDMPEAHHNLGMLLLERGALAEACAALEQAQLLDPGNPMLLASLCQAQMRSGRLDDAEASIRQALLVRESEPHLQAVLAQLRVAQDRAGDAIAALSMAVRLAPDSPVYYLQLARLLRRLDRSEAALASAERALAKAPDFLPALAERAALLLARGRLTEGFRDRDRLFGATATDTAPESEPQPSATPADLVSGATLACRLDGPLPEAIESLRYAAALAHRGVAVTLHCAPALIGLARLLTPPVRLHPAVSEAPTPASEPTPLRLPQVPHRLGLTAETVATAIPYLAAPAERLAAWQHHFSAFPKPWIGYAFVSRSLAERLRAVLRTTGGHCLDLRRSLHAVFDWADLVALIGTLDLVVGDDEIALSLAGALDRNGWLLVPRPPHWRWQEAGATTPFYPSLRLFRQERPGEWDAPATALAAALAAFQAPPAEPLPPPDPTRRFAALATTAAVRPAPPIGPAQAAHRHALEQAERGMALLHAGRCAAGWQGYEGRWAKHGYGGPDRGLGLPRWQGEPLAGRRLLIWPEQGLGDEIMFAALMPRLATGGGVCSLGADPRLVPLFRRSFPGVTVQPVDPDRRRLLAGQVDPGDFDLFVPAGSLAALLAPRLADWPRQTAFLSADPARGAALAAHLAPASAALRVGLCWRSGVRTPRRQGAYTDLSDAEALFGLEGVQVVSLQYGGEAEIEAAERRIGRKIIHVSDLDLIADIDGLAALMAGLDLVIAPPTAVAELAAALGTPVWRTGLATGWTSLGTRCRPWFGAMRPFPGTGAGGAIASLDRVLRHLQTCRPPRRPATA